MRYDSEHKQRTRERLLDEAAAAIRAEGPERVGVAALMKKLGLTHGGFYAHFESKDALVAEAIARMFAGPYARFQAVTQGVAPADGLAAYVDFYLSMRHRDARDRGCPLPALSGDLPRMAGAARERFAEGAETLRRSVASLLEAMGTAEADMLAASVIAEMVGALSLARAIPDRFRAEEILAASRSAIKARLGLHG
jgi:TetR/AcrR family transcriptional repressor of nem operon